jgi:predicted DNA binding CopG/RHH family protein
MKYFELDKKEKEILKDFEAGKFKKVSSIKKRAALYQEHARQSLNKTRNINIRLSHADLQRIKSLAVEKGMPYQTLISSLLHRYSSGRVEEKV